MKCIALKYKHIALSLSPQNTPLQVSMLPKSSSSIRLYTVAMLTTTSSLTNPSRRMYTYYNIIIYRHYNNI